MVTRVALRHLWFFMGACAVLVPSFSAARVRWQTPGSYRLRVTGLDAFPLDSAGQESAQRVVGMHRLRLTPTIEIGAAVVHLQLDVLTGQVFGDTDILGVDYVERRHSSPDREYDGWTTVWPRQAWLELRSDWVDLRVGQMAAGWGMGLLSGDGETPKRADDRWLEPFGDAWNGDLLDRVMVVGRPMRALTHGDWAELELSLGADYVYQDEEANLLDGDRAYQLFAQMYYPGEEVAFGAHAERRWQEDRDGDELDRMAFDAYLRWLVPLYLINAEVRIQAEAVFMAGRTDRWHRAEASEREVNIRALGWAGKAEMAWLCPRIAIGVEGGYASGDADGDDGDARAMTFDPDYRPGLILFSDVMRLISLRSAERLASDDRVGVPPPGVEQLPTDGAVRNAIFFAPGVTWRPGRWRLSGGALFAWAPEPFMDPVNTFDGGGSAQNHLGEDAGHYYGTEVLGAIAYDLGQGTYGAASVGLEGGGFFPGRAFTGTNGADKVGKVVLRADLRW